MSVRRERESEGGENRERKKESVAIHIQGKVQYIYKMYIYI